LVHELLSRNLIIEIGRSPEFKSNRCCNLSFSTNNLKGHYKSIAMYAPNYWKVAYYGVILSTLYTLFALSIKNTKQRGVHVLCLIFMTVGILFNAYLSYFATDILTSALSKLPAIQESKVLRDISLGNTALLIASLLTLLLETMVFEDVKAKVE
jgi:hypothetical protein